MDPNCTIHVPDYPYANHPSLVRSLKDGTAQLVINLGKMVVLGMPQAKIPQKALRNYLRLMMVISAMPFISIILVLTMGSHYELLWFSALYLVVTFLVPVSIVRIRPFYLSLKILTILSVAAAIYDYATFSDVSIFLIVILSPLSTKYNAFLYLQDYVLAAICQDEAAFYFLFSRRAVAIANGDRVFVYPDHAPNEQ